MIVSRGLINISFKGTYNHEYFVVNEYIEGEHDCVQQVYATNRGRIIITL